MFFFLKIDIWKYLYYSHIDLDLDMLNIKQLELKRHWMYISDEVFIETFWIVFRHVSWCIYVYIERILDGFQHRHRISCIGLHPFGVFGLFSAMLADAYIFILNIFWMHSRCIYLLKKKIEKRKNHFARAQFCNYNYGLAQFLKILSTNFS